MMLSVELFFEDHGELKRLELDWFEGMLVQDVLKLANMPSLDQKAIGVFSKQVALDKTVQPGDRIEVYSDLLIDPKEARRHRAKPKKNKK